MYCLDYKWSTWSRITKESPYVTPNGESIESGWFGELGDAPHTIIQICPGSQAICSMPNCREGVFWVMLDRSAMKRTEAPAPVCIAHCHPASYCAIASLRLAIRGLSTEDKSIGGAP